MINARAPSSLTDSKGSVNAAAPTAALQIELPWRRGQRNPSASGMDSVKGFRGR